MCPRKIISRIVALTLISFLLALADSRLVDGDEAGIQPTDSVQGLQTGVYSASYHLHELALPRRLKAESGEATNQSTGNADSGHAHDREPSNEGQGGWAASNDGKPGASGNGKSAAAGNGNTTGSSDNGKSDNGNSGTSKTETPGDGLVTAAGPTGETCKGNVAKCAFAGGSSGGKPAAAGAGPRGDDPRPRAWGKENDRAETEFDDRKSPRTVAFLGRSANVRIYPNYSDPGTYLQLRFGKVQELDRSGEPVPGHSVPSLAEAANVTFAAGNTTVNGVNMSYVNVSLNPLTRQPGFSLDCRPAPSDDDGEALLLNDTASTPPPALLLLGSSVYGGGGDGGGGVKKNPQLSISLLFGLDDALTVPYGDVNVTVPRNGLKWSVSVTDWPFCNESNTLSVSLSLLVANNASAQIAFDAAGSNGAQRLKIVLGSAYNATLDFLDYALDGAAANAGGSANDTKKMPVNITLAHQDGGGGGGMTTVTLGLPNPAAYNVSSGSVWYDPIQTTTSIYLAVNDPGNIDVTARIVPVQNAGNLTGDLGAGGSSTGAAEALRTTLWTAVAALLLGMFVAGPQMAP